MQDYLGVSVASGKKKQGVEETGDTQKATGPKEELQMLQGRKDFRDRTSHGTQTSLTQLPTEQFIFCFGKIKGKLHICSILPKLMGKIPPTSTIKSQNPRKPIHNVFHTVKP